MEDIQIAKDIHLPRIQFGLTWLIALPAGVWAIVDYYLPVMGGTLSPLQVRVMAPAAIVLILLSLYCHIAAHLWMAGRLGAGTPQRIQIMIFGDASQTWPATGDWRDWAVAVSGPAVNLLLAAVGYGLWNVQINDLVGDVAALVAGFNAWLFLVNLMPAFPMDGGRLARGRALQEDRLEDLPLQEDRLRGLRRGTMPDELSLNRWLRGLGFGVAGALICWAIVLFVQNARFSAASAGITAFFAVVLVDGLWTKPVGETEPVRNVRASSAPRALRGVGAFLLVAVLFVPPAGLLLTNDGLEAPGVALSTSTMINVPAAYQHSHPGSLYLVTVISQAPITAGAWALGQVDPAIRIVPPEIVTPKNTTPAEQARQGYQMLNDSETTAIAVGLRLAGYPETAVGKGAQVVSILPESRANGKLQPDDVITAINGQSVQTAAELIARVKALSPTASADLQLLRGPAPMEVIVPLMPVATAGAPPKIGIAIQDAGFDFHPPFPISIDTQKINGGPSAGLMFTLSVYNALMRDDLTGGRKIAGTGTINLDGSVGPIGGVKQKIFAAQAVGASYFLCPADNYADAVSVATTIKVIKVESAEQALAFLQSLPATQ